MMDNTRSGPWMDRRIWSRLPEQLMDRVIAFLSPPAFFRARAVCKRWYSLLFSTSFLHLYLHLSPRHSSFLFFASQIPNTRANTTTVMVRSDNSDNDSGGGDDDKLGATAVKFGYLFDPVDLSWYRLSFTFVPTGFSPVSSSGGLICWASDSASPKTLILCNPLLGVMTQLPPTLRPRLFPSAGLSVSPSSIDVLVAGDDLISPYAVKNLTAEAFHVDASGFYSIWGTSSSLPRLCSLESSGRMVYVDPRFYCMNYSPFSILAYDPAANDWTKIQAPMRRFLRSPSLVESRGRLLLVAAVEKSKLNVPRSLRLWALTSSAAAGASAWTEIERMPPQLYTEFAAAEGNRGFDCVAHGQFVVIVIRGSSEKAVLFDFGSKRWRWMPPCPFVLHNNSNNGTGSIHQQQLQGFAYEPRLSTPITGLLDHFTLPFHSLPFSS